MTLGAITSETTGQSCVVIPHPSGARVEVQLHGATVTSFKTSTDDEVLFLSDEAVFNGAKAIRGGIPLVFPQFGQPDKSMPSHGLARTSKWELWEEGPEGSVEAGHVKANFVLGHSDESMSKWPHPFSLRYEVDLAADVLAVTLHVTNPGDQPFDFQALLHTYLRLREIEDVKIEGFQGTRYVDQLQNNASSTDERAHAVFAQEVDRIYSGEIGDIQVVGGTRVSNSCTKKGPGGEECVPVDVVLWNPWIAKAKACQSVKSSRDDEIVASLNNVFGSCFSAILLASPLHCSRAPRCTHHNLGQSLADFGDEEYHNMVCIEPGLVSKFYSIAPGETFSLKQVIMPP